jgi:hypothetical protein
MTNTKLAVAVGAGYLLGRMHKGRWALTLAGLAAGRQLKNSPGGLLGGLLESSPQLRELAGTVGGDLADAGKKAVVSAAGRRIEALTDRLEGGTSALRGVGGGKRDDEHSEEPEDRDADEDEDVEEEDEDKRTSARRSRTSSARSSGKPSASKSSASKPSSARGGSRAAGRPAARTARSGGGTAATTAKKTAKKTAGTARKQGR